MNIKCDKYLLNDAVAGVSKAITSKSAIPVLEGIHLKAEGFQLTLTGYDFEMAIITTIECDVKTQGEIVISAKLFGDIIRKIPGEEIEINVDDNNNVTIKSGITQYTLMGIDPSEYPALPKPDVEKTVEIEPAILCDMVNTTIFAVATDDKRPAHTGELFCFTKNNLKLVALDGLRLAITEREIICDKEINIIIPQKTLHEVIKLVSEDETPVQIMANKRFVMFSNSKYTIIRRLIEGEFLDYENVIPKSVITEIVVDTKEFIDVIERASLMITERLKNPLRILFDTSNNIHVNCKTSLGSVTDEISAQVTGENVEIGFNNRYLMDALRYSGKEKVKFLINGALSPVIIKPEDDDKFLFLVLPVRFKN